VTVRELRVVVVAEDFEGAVEFYRDGLGLASRAAVSGPGGAEVVILEAGRATLEIANPAQRDFIDEVEVGRVGVSPASRVAFEVDDAAAATARLATAGATVLAEPRATPFGSVNARLEAPGLQVTLFETRAGVEIRDATPADWDAAWVFVQPILAAGETYTLPRELGEDAARDYWFPADGGTVVAVRDGTVAGIGKWLPNQRGPGAHVANASFMVDPVRAGQGIGRRLGEHVLRRAKADGFTAMQFNAVVATNTGAVRLWRDLGFVVVGTVPGAFDHPRHGPVDLLIMYRAL
jgi:GNAT superfamily N-acetyltransferase/predicted enzyme related to lactoylglutathione lyase